MLDSIDQVSAKLTQAARSRRLFSAIVLAALDEAIGIDKKGGDGGDFVSRWARSADGREILSCAGIEPSALVARKLAEFVKRGKGTHYALAQRKRDRRKAPEDENEEDDMP